MRRLASIAAFSLMLAVPVWAQRGGHGGGGHFGGGGMHAGGFAGHVGGPIGGARMGGIRSFSGAHSVGARSFPGVPHSFNRSFNRGLSRVPFRDRGFRGRRRDFDDFGFNNCFGFACRNWGWGSNWWGWGGWGWGWYDPWLWSTWEDEDRRFDQDYYGQYAMAERWNQQNLEEQRMLREEDEEGDQDAYAPRTSNRRSAPETASQPPEPMPATVLVFHDQHRQEVQNYAIVGQTLWAFSAGRTQKIPLTDLDVTATEKANDDRGVTFRVPAKT